MSALAAFLQRLLYEGKVLLRDRPHPVPSEAGEARAVLAHAYADYRLEVAGPPIPFDAETALAAGELVRQACWFLVHHGEPEEELQRTLHMPTGPATAAQHLSADLVLRYLPQIYRRARAHAPTDQLTVLLASVLRQWPLSGVLADVEEAPMTPLDFGGHDGLMLLYAERLARHKKPAWVPAGRPLEYVEWVSPDLANQGATPPVFLDEHDHRE
jgi:hypothetical protein